ncbi:hypothetical protein JCM11251_005208 [Rhodosporidiobolus azoricus]
MSRRRSASLSRPAFVDPALAFSPDAALDALALAGRDGPIPSRSRSNSLAADEASRSVATAQLHVELSLTEACEVQVVPSRPFVKVRNSTRPSSSKASRLPAGRPVPKRAMTRMVPEELTDGSVNPLESEGFREGLRKAGYLAPIDTSRKAIKGRFVHGLDKEEFKAHLDSFLDDKSLRSRGEYMVRFRGPTTDVHSPFVHLFLTALPSDTTTVKLFADAPTVKKPGTSTTWTYLPQDNPDESHWACKAKSFWPVRVCFEGPKATDIVPGTVLDKKEDPRSRRRKRRDTFQREVDLDEVAKKQEAEEEQALKDNTHLNSLRLGEAPSLKLDTSERQSSSSRKSRAPVEEEEQVGSPSTPTILASAKQLGQSIVATVQPAVQHGLEDFKKWWTQQQTVRAEEPEFFDDEDEDEERQRRRERRRRRRERRAREEAEEQPGRRGRWTEDEIETNEVERMAREEERLEKEERRRRRAARRTEKALLNE